MKESDIETFCDSILEHINKEKYPAFVETINKISQMEITAIKDHLKNDISKNDAPYLNIWSKENANNEKLNNDVSYSASVQPMPST